MQDSILQLFPQTLPTRIQPSATLRFPVDDVASHVLLALSCACGRLGEGEAACPPGVEGGQRAEILALLTTRATATGAFIGLVAGMIVVLSVAFGMPYVAFLWHNLIGAVVVVVVGMAVSSFSR